MIMRFGKEILVLLLCLLLSTLTPAAAAQNAVRHPAGPAATAPQRPKTLLDYREQLGLSDQQVEQIKAVLEDYQKDYISLNAKLRTNEIEARDLVIKEADFEL